MQVRRTGQGRGVAAAGRGLAAAALLLGAAPGGRAQAVLRKDLKKDFGALGDGRANDQAAFGRASAFFNARALTLAGTGRAVLFIPRGVYLVGRQDAGGGAYRSGADVLALVGCRNLSIEGADSAATEIRYADGLLYGSFDPATGRAYRPPTVYFDNRAYAASGGTCIRLQRCENVVVARLALNGNSPRLAVGGAWGDTGIQLPFDGVFVNDCRGVSLQRIAVHHFGRDGVQVLNRLAKSLDDPALENIVLENSTFDYNGRQGLSLTGVNGLRAVNCSFSHTARVQNPTVRLGAGHALFSNPAAGVDVEPEGGYVTNAVFTCCRLVDNGGQGLVSDRPGGGRPATTRNVRLIGCTLWGTTNWSAWVTQPGFLFQNCFVYGAFVHGCPAATAAEATCFQGCTFEDKPYAGRPALGPFLLFSDRHARGLRFVDCRFVATRGALVHAVPLAPDSAAGFYFHGCAFVLDNVQPSVDGANVIAGGVFTGRTEFRDGPHRPGGVRADFWFGSSAAPGPNAVPAPGSLALRARNFRLLVRGGFDVGRAPAGAHDSARVVVGPANALVLVAAPHDTSELYIGSAARVVVKRGGALELRRGTKITVAGRVVIEDGGYFFRDPLAVVRTVGRGAVQVAPGAILAKHPTLSED